MRTLRADTRQDKNLLQKGFTLIEMAIVITIVGLIIASSATAYVQWQTWLRHDTTQNNVETIHAAIEGFLNTNGRYPCPSSLQATRTDAGLYGLEPTAAGFDCNSVVAGDINLPGSPPGTDIYVTAGARAIAAGHIQNDGTPSAVGATPQVRIGMIPFRSLGLSEDIAFDGHRNRIYYAVTDHMTSSLGFDNGTTGAISVVDDLNNDLTSTAGNVHFLVFSAGENGAGAFNREGFLNACPAVASQENENCDFTLGAGNATFRIGQYSTSTGNNAMDDRVAYGISTPPLFERPVGGDLDDGVTKSASNLGIGAIRDNPTEEMDIAGVVRAQAPLDDPLTTGIDESLLGGSIEASELCDNGSNSDCFAIESIAGAIADGGGMQCGSGNYIIGIRNNAPVCGIVDTGCPDPEIIIGIDNNGNAICSGATGNPSCRTAQFPVCGVDQTASFGTDGTIRSLTGGINRVENYICDAGTWRPNGSSGVCACTPTAPILGDQQCSIRSDCNIRFNGRETIQVTAETCMPPGTSATTILDQSACICNPTPRNQQASCEGIRNRVFMSSFITLPPGDNEYNSGTVNIQRATQCPARTCTPWTLTNEDCGCIPETNIETSACDTGYIGTRTRSNNFVCNSGGGVGDYGRNVVGPWDESGCTCDPTPTITVVRCEDRSPSWTLRANNPHGGIRVQTVRVDNGTSCVSTSTDLDTLTEACDPPQPAQCAWAPGGTSGPGNHPRNLVGNICACGTSNAPCQEGTGTRHTQCSCNPI